MRLQRAGCVALVFVLTACAASSGGPPPLDLSGTVVPVAPAPAQDAVLKLLWDGNFDGLHALFERYRAASLADLEHGEAPLIAAYEAFGSELWDPTHNLDRWVKMRPRSWHAHAARAFHFEALAAEARGTVWSKEVSEANRSKMTRFHAMAKEAAQTALALQPRNLVPHFVLVRMARHHGTLAEASKDAMSAFPASYELRLEIAWGLQPRWCCDAGDYTRIDRFAKETQEYVPQNPRLRALLGMPYWARGQDLSTAKQYDAAIKMYGLALNVGEAPTFLYSRAYAASQVHDYRQAFRDAQRWWEIIPKAPGAAPPGRAMHDALRSARAWAGRQMEGGRDEEALQTLDVILQANPNDGLATLLRGITRCRAGQLSLAESDFQRAMTLHTEPDDVRRMQSACALTAGDPGAALLRMQAAILAAPGDGEAHHRLASVLSLVGDVPSAIRAHWVACELGQAASCKRFSALRKTAEKKAFWPQDVGGRLHPQLRLSGEKHREFLESLAASDDYGTGGAPVRFLERPMPDYPLWVRDAKQGSVKVHIYFKANGTVAGARIEDSSPAGYFEVAALAAVLRWRIEPREHGLKAIQRIDFQLPPDRPFDPDEDVLIAGLDR